MSKNDKQHETEQVAGNGLLHRRMFLSGSAALLGSGFLGITQARAANPSDFPEWMRVEGASAAEYGLRSSHEADVLRLVNPRQGAVAIASGSRTPLERLEGMITPNALHFERHHSGIPDINPDEHQLMIHGLVRRPLRFSMDALHRYPMETRTHFIECSGNSRTLNDARPVQGTAGSIHGLLSCSEWTGIPLAILLDEAGLDPEASWILAEGADAAAMSRSIPMSKALDDAMLVLYQNGEAIRPSNGYPLRLLVPGFEGNANVKWLRRLKVTNAPTMTRDETSKYTDLLPDGTARMFSLSLESKSVITSPSGGQQLNGPGLYQISGLAWSGHGRITKVEVSADGGLSWAEAALSGPVLPKSLTRFRLPWRWNGHESVLMSRATDETGFVQPDRQQVFAKWGTRFNYHTNSIQCWGISGTGAVTNVYV